MPCRRAPDTAAMPIYADTSVSSYSLEKAIVTDKPTVSVIGLGNMGGGMARTLVRGGYQVTGYDRSSAARDRAAAGGVTIASSLLAAADKAEVLISVLPDTSQVVSCYLDQDGILGALSPGALCIECSTIEPAATDRLADVLATANCSLVDAAMGRSPIEAETGDLLFMVGGTDQDIARARPLLDTLGNQTEHCGPVGTGIRTKLTLNLLSQATCQLSAEVVALGLKMGLDRDSLLTVLGSGLGANGFITRYWPAKVLAGDTEPGFAIELSAKDLRYAVAMAAEAGVAIPTGQAAAAVNRAARTHGGVDVSGLLQVACDQVGVDIGRDG